MFRSFGGCTLVRSMALALLAVLFALLLFPGSQPPASASGPDQATPVIATAPADAEANRYAGADGASPLDEVPVVPMIAGTAGLLGVLGIVAIRRDWV